MAFDFSTLVTDRTQQDVAYARQLAEKLVVGTATEEEKAEWNSFTLKGVYNHTDLNRVTAAMEYLKARLEGYGYAVPGYKRIRVPHPEESRLPEGYTELQYIESSGTQYIDTGFIPNQDTKLTMKVMATTTDNAATSGGFVPYGSSDSSTGNAYECYTWNSNQEANYNGQRATLSAAIKDKELIITQDKNAFSLVASDGTTMSKAFTYNTFTAPRTLLLFATHRSTPLKGKQKIYSCQLYDNGTLVRNFVPCINPSGVVGLYDLVGGKFYGNAGSGVFVTGPEVYGVDDRVQLLLHGEELADSSGHAREITNYGVTVSGTKGKFGGKSLHFNGNSYLTVPVPVEGDMTIDFWVYITGYDVSDPTIFSYATASGWRGVYTHVYSSTTTWGASTPSTQYNAVQGTPISINTWHHIAAVRSGTITKFYLDGVLDGTLTDNDPTNGVLYLGEALDVPSISKFSGYVDELRISNVARWHGNFTPKESAYALPAEKNTTNDSAHVEYDPYLWYEFDWPTPETMATYLLNVSAIRAVLEVTDSTPNVPDDTVGLMVKEANDIEVILRDVYRQLNIMATTFIPCGEALCGGDNL